MFFITLEVGIRKSSSNIKFSSEEIKKSKIVGYKIGYEYGYNSIKRNVLILEDNLHPVSEYDKEDGLIHPVYVTYGESELSEFKINNLLEEL